MAVLQSDGETDGEIKRDGKKFKTEKRTLEISFVTLKQSLSFSTFNDAQT